MKKRIIFSLIIIVIIIFIAGFFFFNHVEAPINQNPTIKPVEQKIEANPQKPANNQPEVKTETPKAETSPVQDFQGITICQDQCGDRICQNSETPCTQNDYNCVCNETKQDCPQDCK